MYVRLLNCIDVIVFSKICQCPGREQSYLKVHWLADSVTIVASIKKTLNIVQIKEIKAIVLKVGIFVLLLKMVFFLLEKKRCRSCDQDERPPTTDQTGGEPNPVAQRWKELNQDTGLSVLYILWDLGIFEGR